MDISDIRHTNLRILLRRMLLAGRSLKDCAVALNMSPSYLSQLRGGKKLGDDVARKIEESADLPRGWMDVLQVDEGTRVPAWQIRAVDRSDGVDKDREVFVNEIDVELGAGDGVALEFVETKYRLPYQIEWLRSVGVSDPDDVRLMSVRGHSMERTLFDGDKVLINLRATRIVSDSVFAIMLDGEPRIKRLFNVSGGVRVVSDNEDKVKYPDEFVSHDHDDRLRIIGRAIHRQGSRGL